MCHNIINYRYSNAEKMPYTILVKKLNDILVVLTSFVKDTQGINTVKRIKQTFGPSILKLHLQCIYATLGLDLCTRMRDEKMILVEYLSNGWEGYDFDSNLILEYEKTRYLTFQRNRRYASLFRDALGKEMDEIVSKDETINGGNLNT